MNLQELRNKVKKAQAESKTKSTSSSYPFWNAPTDTNSILRFLPFKNEEEEFFWKEQHTIPLTFCGVENHDESQQFTIRIPCATMYGMKDKIVEHIRPLWETDKETARKFYFKKSFLMYGFVQKSPFEEVNVNDIRRFSVSNSIFAKVRDGLLDEDLGLVNHPCDQKVGCDFVVKKTQSGQYADYSASTWAKRESELSKDQKEVYANSLLSSDEVGFSKPDDALWETYYEMFLASYNGDLYKEEWLAIQKPWGFDKKEED